VNAIPTRIDAHGRLVVPKEVREALGLPQGGEVQLTVRDGVLEVASPAVIVRRLQERVRAYQGRSADRYTTDDFLKDRHDEAARDDP
jgi:AbrB family looped-hinge helix DNA binding protein